MDIVLLVGKLLINTVGICVNVSLIVVTALNSSLQGTCNILLVAQALSIAISQLTLWIKLFIFVFRGTIPLRMCLIVQIVPNLGLNFSNLIILFIGMDRLICVIFPIKMRNLEITYKKTYVTVITAVCLLYALWVEVLCHQAIWEVENTQVQCSTLDLYPGWVSTLTWYIVLTIAAAVVLIYATLWMVLRTKSTNQTASVSATRNLFPSLAANVTVVVVVWTLNSTARNLIQSIGMSAWFTSICIYLNACIYAIFTSANVPILYLFSSDYRKCYNLVHRNLSSRVCGVAIGTTIENSQRQNRESTRTAKWAQPRAATAKPNLVNVNRSVHLHHNRLV